VNVVKENRVRSLVTQTVIVTTTYLHIPTPADFRPATSDDPDLTVVQSPEPSVAFYRFLYDAVGRDFVWVDRLAWTDARLRAHLARPTTTVVVLSLRGTPVGYIELDAASEEPGTEIAYFGLVPAVHGRGFGRHLLSVGVQRAFDDGAARIWLHTCTLDGPHALTNYMARGFVPYRTTTHEEAIRAEPPGSGEETE
jgi:GNAT superfamily N-acetyltransferase